MRTAVAAPAPEPIHQEIADLIDSWLWLRVAEELIAEMARQEKRRLDQVRRDWWEKQGRRW